MAYNNGTSSNRKMSENNAATEREKYFSQRKNQVSFFTAAEVFDSNSQFESSTAEKSLSKSVIKMEIILLFFTSDENCSCKQKMKRIL